MQNNATKDLNCTVGSNTDSMGLNKVTCSTHAVHMQYTCSKHAVHLKYTAVV